MGAVAATGYAMNPTLERFKATFNELNADNLDRLDAIYAADVDFRDPVHALRGLDALRAYYRRLYAGVEACRFDYTDTVVQGGTAVVLWTMHLRHRRFRAGETLVLDGASHLRFGERVYRHHDYFDMGAFIYERVPVLGAVIRRIKSGL